MAKKSSSNFRLMGKIGFLVVIIGFFMPIACDNNGFEIAGHLMDRNETLSGILMWVLFISAVVGLVIGVLLLMKKSIKLKKLDPAIDWAAIVICIVSGLIVYFKHLDVDGLKLQTGAFVILVGWIIALALQLMSKLSKET